MQHGLDWRTGMSNSLPSEYLFPFLFITLAVLYCFRLARAERLLERAFVPVVISVSAVLSFVRFGSLSLSEYLLSLSPSYSIGLISLVLIVLYERICGRILLSRRDLLIFALWNVIISGLLFISYMGFIDADLYYQGYGFSFWLMLPAVSAITLALLRCPLAFIFAAYLVSYDIDLLHSENIWDYMTDGILFIVSLVILSAYAVKLLRRRGRQEGHLAQ